MRCASARAFVRVAALLLAAATWGVPSFAADAESKTDAAATLKARYVTFYEHLARSPFLQNLEVESFESDDGAGGDIYSVVDHPIVTVAAAFTDPTAWCDALILHFNVKYCHPVAHEDDTVLSVAVGSKGEQSLEDAHRIEFVYRIVASRPDYLHVELNADEGPYGTGDYRIALEGVGMGSGWSFLRLQYSYTYGFLGRIAMGIYLATSGGDKVGFTVKGVRDDGTPRFIGGERGAVERQTVRYFLAIEAYLGALAVPVEKRFEASLEQWFAATERYPRQLHEMNFDKYLAMKRKEYARQQRVE